MRLTGNLAAIRQAEHYVAEAPGRRFGLDRLDLIFGDAHCTGILTEHDHAVNLGRALSDASVFPLLAW